MSCNFSLINANLFEVNKGVINLHWENVQIWKGNRESMKRWGVQKDVDRLIIGRVKLASSRSLESNCR
jgi:hypothetical protein